MGGEKCCSLIYYGYALLKRERSADSLTLRADGSDPAKTSKPFSPYLVLASHLSAKPPQFTVQVKCAFKRLLDTRRNGIRTHFTVGLAKANIDPFLNRFPYVGFSEVFRKHSEEKSYLVQEYAENSQI